MISQLFSHSHKITRTQLGTIGFELTPQGAFIAQVQYRDGQVSWVGCQEVCVDQRRERISAFSSKSKPSSNSKLAEYCRVITKELIGFNGRNVTLTLPFDESRLSLVTLPSASDREIRDMIRIELEADDSRSHLDHFVNWPTPIPAPWNTPGLSHHCLYRASSTEIASVLHELQQCGMDCTQIDILPFALARALNHSSYDSTTRPIGLLHLAHEQSLFLVVENGQPIYTRKLKRFSYQAMVNQICQELSISNSCAESLLHNVGLSGATQPSSVESASRRSSSNYILAAEVFVIVSKFLRQLTLELEKTLRFIHSEISRPLWPNIIMTGEGATISDLQEWSISTQEYILTPWRFPDASRAVPHVIHPRFAVATGLSTLPDKE